MRRISKLSALWMSLCAVSVSSQALLAETQQPLSAPTEVALVAQAAPPEVKAEVSDFRGWNFLVEKLRKDGISEEELKHVYGNKLMPAFTAIPFRMKPKESKKLYQPFTDPKRIALGTAFLKSHEALLRDAEQVFQADRFVVTAILLIETQIGRVTGNELVIYRLSRLASIADPANVRENYENLLKEDRTVKFEAVEERARYLEQMFYPEIPALLTMEREKQINLFKLRGSVSGAFGIPQFLPSTYLRFGADGNKDGIISLFDPPDAVWSAANFLSGYGWRGELTQAQKREILWNYNHSEAYVESVLDVAELLRKAPQSTRKNKKES